MEALGTTSLGERSPWQDLPSELLGLVLQRVPSHAGRVRLRAVCRPWRDGARLQPPLPPLLPLLLQRDGTFLSLPDGTVHRIPVPDGVSCLMSTGTGSMLFLGHGDGRCSLLNPFCRDTTTPQYVDADCFGFQIPSGDPIVHNVRKVVIMSDHIITIQKTFEGYNCALSIRRRGQSTTTVDVRWMPHVAAYSFDAELFQEKLHIILSTHVGTIDLYVMDLIKDDNVSLQCILSTPVDNLFLPFGHIVDRYLVSSGDQLLLVKQDICKLYNKLMSAQFEVFEATDLSNGHAQWRKVDTLMGRALFLSAGCSMSLPASDRYAGAREDCIYFLCELGCYGIRKENLSFGIYDLRKGTLLSLPSETMVAQQGPQIASWLFPSNT
ncbi:hypothetical protein QYE76_048593 [Lolium multiflorum]|uniref:DUF295 domain-containing protein n=1 Tax=Lolium multiflorum TaxID=4521 RepID=A0AAD8SMM7_LOLMU|nr:hypothetical protein QYE76_048593 [Lolium multiflorum]